ncbi:MAG TPA: hypothetical protein VHU84_06190 [Lacipirellulaceae bacterium]|nr:hypothetical protein [Lacipirellulaceae bacterium]
MVTVSETLTLSSSILLAAEAGAGPVLEQLDLKSRFFVVMALLGIVLIGLFLIIFVMVGGHWVRGLARHRPRKGQTVIGGSAPDDGQLRQALESVLPETITDDTVQLGKSPKDTKIGS